MTYDVDWPIHPTHLQQSDQSGDTIQSMSRRSLPAVYENEIGLSGPWALQAPADSLNTHAAREDIWTSLPSTSNWPRICFPLSGARSRARCARSSAGPASSSAAAAIPRSPEARRHLIHSAVLQAHRFAAPPRDLLRARYVTARKNSRVQGQCEKTAVPREQLRDSQLTTLRFTFPGATAPRRRDLRNCFGYTGICRRPAATPSGSILNKPRWGASTGGRGTSGI